MIVGLLGIASYASQWRGYEYFHSGNVLSCHKNGDGTYSGEVAGSTSNSYQVTIDAVHPKKSTCCCPFAEGAKKVCKHKVALYFTAFPAEAEKYYTEVIKAEKEERQRQEEQEDRLNKYIKSLTKNELKQHLYEVLYDGPEWLFERFIREHVND